uniref:WKF domain-containing protein n=1 Tax=Anopheles dirus TaxID=7168 RepID=A0A182NJY6_9DIPT
MGKINKLKKSKEVEGATEEVAPSKEVEKGNGVKKEKTKKNKAEAHPPSTNAVVEAAPEDTVEKKKKKKRSVEPDNATEEVPSKLSKGSDANTIVAGTSIDQISGMNLEQKKSKRENKRDAHAAKVEQTKKQLQNKEWQNIRQYLESWKNNRKQWKFQKRLQTNIQLHVFDEGKLNDDLWPIAVEYLSETKGEGRAVLVKLAKAVISEGDEDETMQDSTKYKRARELLQSLG